VHNQSETNSSSIQPKEAAAVRHVNHVPAPRSLPNEALTAVVSSFTLADTLPQILTELVLPSKT